MKILLVNKFYFPKGGAERHFLALKELLEKHGHEVIPFSLQHPENLATPYAQYFISGADLEKPKMSFRSLAQTLKIIWNLEARHKIERLIQKTKPDFAHLHNIYHQISPSILPILKKQKIPTVMTIHDFKLICPNYQLLNHGQICERCRGKKYYHCFLQKCHKDSHLSSLILTLEMYLHKFLKVYEKNIDWFISPSQFFKDKLIEFSQKGDNISVLPNFINLQKYNFNHQYENYAVFFGRLSPEKGVSRLIKAWSKVEANFHLKIVGAGPEKENLIRLTEKLKLKNVDFLGYQTGEKLAKILQNCLFTITPSICYENSPLSVLESMAYGKAVLASRLGGIPEIVDEQTGRLFNPGNLDELREKINYLAQNKELTIKLGKAARKKVEEKHQPEKYYQELMKIYEKFSQE